MSKRTLQERILEAEHFANRWLGDANEAAESGKHAKAEKCGEKAQYWLDKLNELEGYNDMGQPTEAPAPEPTPAQSNVFYTSPIVSADGEQIKARVTTTDDGHVVEVLANGMVIISETETFYFRGWAIDAAQSKAIAYLHELNRQRAIEMVDETETPASNYPMSARQETPRIKQLREMIARNERELESLRFELEQLLTSESKPEPVALNDWQVETLKKAAAYKSTIIPRNALIDAANSHAEIVWFVDLQDKGFLCLDDDYKRHYNITVKGRAYLVAQE